MLSCVRRNCTFGLLDALILWRNERERAQPLVALMDAFELKTHASLQQLDSEAQALEVAPFGIGHITLCCALGYLDYRFDAPGLARLAAPFGRLVRCRARAAVNQGHGTRR